MEEAEPYTDNKHISNKALTIKQVSPAVGIYCTERQAHVPDVFHQILHSTKTLKVHSLRIKACYCKVSNTTMILSEVVTICTTRTT